MNKCATKELKENYGKSSRTTYGFGTIKSTEFASLAEVEKNIETCKRGISTLLETADFRYSSTRIMFMQSVSMTMASIPIIRWSIGKILSKGSDKIEWIGWTKCTKTVITADIPPKSLPRKNTKQRSSIIKKK